MRAFTLTLCMLFTFPVLADVEFWTAWQPQTHSGVQGCELADARRHIAEACSNLANPLPGGNVKDREDRKFSKSNGEKCCGIACESHCRTCSYYVEYRCLINISN